MKAIIFSDDSALATRTRSTLNRVARRPEVGIDWIMKHWRVITLRDASSSINALLEAADAHLIVIPAEYARSLPVHLHEWLEQWAGLREIEDAAVAVVGDNTSAGLRKGWDPDLGLLAQRHGLNLIMNEATVEETVAAKLPVRFSTNREQALPIRLAHLSYAVMPDGCRGFGIND